MPDRALQWHNWLARGTYIKLLTVPKAEFYPKPSLLSAKDKSILQLLGQKNFRVLHIHICLSLSVCVSVSQLITNPSGNSVKLTVLGVIMVLWLCFLKTFLRDMHTEAYMISEIHFKIKRELPWIYPREMKTHVHIWMCTGALLKAAQQWKQPKCPSTDE
jgi:hypothetical protein